MRDIEAADMAQLDPFELWPEAFTRVQLRGIGGQPLQVQPLCRAMHQELLEAMTAMHRGAIPDEDHAAWHFTQQVFQEGDHIRRVDGMVLTVEVPFALRRDRGDRRQMVAGPPLPQDGRLAHRRIRAHDTGEGIKPGLVDEEDALWLGWGPLLMAGQVALRPCAIAPSSRWRARRAGFCGLQQSTWHKRPTWRGWYEIPNASCMTAAIRPRVQTWPRKP